MVDDDDDDDDDEDTHSMKMLCHLDSPQGIEAELGHQFTLHLKRVI